MKNTSSLAKAFMTSITCVAIYHLVCRYGKLCWQMSLLVKVRTFLEIRVTLLWQCVTSFTHPPAYCGVFA